MSSVHEMFVKLSAMRYSEQAIWFLNGFWAEEKGNAETVYNAYEKFVELDMESDKKKGEEGNELDHFWAARFLEVFDKAMTAKARKEALAKMDVDQNGNMSLIEYLTWKYDKELKHVADAPQGDNQDALAKAQAKMDEVSKALALVLAAIEKLKADQVKLAQLKVELEAAVAALRAEEEAYAKKCNDLQAKIDNPATSGMQKAKATNELAQFKSEDPLPLRRAKITQEAALRKVQKQRKIAEEAQRAAEEKKAALVEAERALEATKRALEEKEAALKVAVDELEVAYNELSAQFVSIEEELTAAKQGGGTPHGALWFTGRELYEKDFYLPTARRRYDHSKPFQYSEN
eukprot:TRINITY_DN133_c0_g1_i4.p1 TRINITY_DN133_c0_g1~~TRINITY_DN133_c0_g1_i4.p1  ORF type:complete len:364 (-),score=203.97 TRINITY_DN133_c0_g1_i4:125-1165(-)